MSWSSMLMHMFDASSAIHGWDNYPINQFPRLWDWIAQCINEGDIAMSDVALTEVNDKSPDCGQWLRDAGLSPVVITPQAVQIAGQLKAALNITHEAYNPNGVDENDLLIIASAKDAGVQLVSNERKQASLPIDRPKYKIPAACAVLNPPVPCEDFLDFIRASGKEFT